MLNENKSARVARHVSPIPFCRVWQNGMATERQNEAQKNVGNPPRFLRPENRSKDTFVCARLVITLLSWYRAERAITTRISRNAARLLLKLELHRFIGPDHLGFISSISRYIGILYRRDTEKCVRECEFARFCRWSVPRGDILFGAKFWIIINASRKSRLMLQMKFSEVPPRSSIQPERSLDVNFSFRRCNGAPLYIGKRKRPLK